MLEIGPLDALTAKELADEALKVAQGTGLPGAHNGQQDAFRHAYWNCRMAQELGVDQAKSVGDIHEACGKNEPGETSMDLYNNEVGRSLGKPGVDCKKACLEALRNGDLQVKPGGTTKPSPY